MWNGYTLTTRVFGRSSTAKASRFLILPFMAPRRTVCQAWSAYTGLRAPGSRPHSRSASTWPPSSARGEPRPARSEPWVFRIVCVPDRLAQTLVELGPVENDFLRVHRGDGRERNAIIARVFDIDYQFAAAVPRNSPNGAERLVVVGDEDFEAFLDCIHPGTPDQFAPAPDWRR